MNSPLLDVNGAAEHLGISRKTLYKWVEAGRVPYVRIGLRLLRFRERDLEEWVESALHLPSGSPSTGLIRRNERL